MKMLNHPPVEVLDRILSDEGEPTGPLHAHLKRVLRLAIDDHFEHGQRFWPENLLIERIDMSHSTVRRALGDLKQEGVLERRVAKGSFVRKVVDPTLTAVGVLVAQYTSEDLNQCMQALSTVCREHGYWFHVQPTHGGENVQEVLRQLEVGPTLKRWVLLGNHPSLTDELWDALHKRGDQVVCIGTPAQGQPAHYVGTDDFQAMQIALEFLRDLGHHRIVFVLNETTEHPSVIKREQAFVALSEQLKFSEAKVISCQTRFWEDSGQAVLRVMPQVKELAPTALITVSDIGAWVAMSWLAQQGVAVPQQMSVLSFDNSYTSQYTSPPLTSLSHPYLAFARWAIELLDNPAREPQKILLRPELVQRRSTTLNSR